MSFLVKIFLLLTCLTQASPILASTNLAIQTHPFESQVNSGESSSALRITEKNNFIYEHRYQFESCPSEAIIYQQTIPFFHDGEHIIKEYETCLIERNFINFETTSAVDYNAPTNQKRIYLGESLYDNDFEIIAGDCDISPWVQNLDLKGAAASVYFCLAEHENIVDIEDHEALAALTNHLSTLGQNKLVAFYDHANTDNEIKDFVLFGKSEKDGTILKVEGSNALCSALLREEIFTIEDFENFYPTDTWFSACDVEEVISHVDITADIPEGYNLHSIDYASFSVPHVKDWEVDDPVPFFEILDYLEDLYTYQLQQHPDEIVGTEYTNLESFIANARSNPTEWLSSKLHLRMNLIACLDLLGAFSRYSYSLEDLYYREKSSFKNIILQRENDGIATALDPIASSTQYLNKWDTDCAFFLGFDYLQMYIETVFEPVMVANVISRFSKITKSYKSFKLSRGDIDDLLKKHSGGGVGSLAESLTGTLKTSYNKLIANGLNAVEQGRVIKLFNSENKLIAEITNNQLVFKYSGYGGDITVVEGKTTAIFGRFNDPIHSGGTKEFIQNPNKVYETGSNPNGLNILNIEDWTWTKNEAWVIESVNRGDIIRFISDPTNPANIFKNGVNGERTVTGLEVSTLENLGYVWEPNAFQYIKQ